jgi:hypothetical protein
LTFGLPLLRAQGYFDRFTQQVIVLWRCIDGPPVG